MPSHNASKGIKVVEEVKEKNVNFEHLCKVKTL